MTERRVRITKASVTTTNNLENKDLKKNAFPFRFLITLKAASKMAKFVNWEQFKLRDDSKHEELNNFSFSIMYMATEIANYSVIAFISYDSSRDKSKKTCIILY